MTRLVARLILAMLILPSTGVVCILLFAAIVVPFANGGPPPVTAVLVMWILTYLFVGAYWTFLWRSVVRWTPRRRQLTMLAAPAAIGLGVAFGMIFLSLAPKGSQGPPLSIAALVGGGLPPIAWVLATVVIWRETGEERLARMARAGGGALVCPICGYNMAGLNEAACPECGSRFTIEQLIAAQPEQDRRALQDV